ncbi:magnesium transporter [Coemansia mojavensis]|nr:magnesium transporter [Coemansia mojavensis]
MQAAPPRYTSKLWILGLVLNYMGEIFGNAVALSYLSAAVVAPIGIVSVLVNVVLAEKFLHERITRNQRFGFLVIVAGVGCILLVAPRSSGASDATQFVSMVQTSGILGLFALMYMVQAALVMLIRSGRQSLFLYVLVASIFGSMNVMVSKIMTMYLRLKMVFSAMPNPADLVVYGVSGATGSSMLSLPQILVGAVMAGSVIGQESFRQQALGRYPVMQFQPVFFATYNVVATLSGLLLFKELSGWFQGLVFFAMFSVGIALILYGSRFLQKAKSVVLPSHIRLDKENLLKTQ